jgi:hypothetical protein
MFFTDESGPWSLQLPKDNQIVPRLVLVILAVLIAVLVLSLVSEANVRHTFYRIAMILDNFALPWNWSYGHSTSAPAPHQRKKSKKSHVRSGSGAERSAQNGSAKHGSHCLSPSHFLVCLLSPTQCPQLLVKKRKCLCTTQASSTYQAPTAS